MSNPIPKINKLKKTEAFLQINYQKGHKFVDKAGEYLNSVYQAGEAVPAHTMSPHGMNVRFSDKKEIKVTPHSIWVHLAEPNAFDEEKRELLFYANLVNDIICPEKYTRVGWRSYFIYECAGNHPRIVPDEVLHGGTFDEIVFNTRIAKCNARVSVSYVINQETKQNAILFDIDMFRQIVFEKKDYSEVTRTVAEIESALRSDDFLKLLNEILTYGQSKR